MQTAMADVTSRHVQLTPAQVEAVRRELTSALDQLDTLDHLCSIQHIASRIEEAISAALYIVQRAETAPHDPS